MAQASEFEAVFKHPSFKKHQRALRIRARANRMHRARLGLVVAKRQVPRANDRNRLKRICRERFRAVRLQLPAVDIVIQVLGNQSNGALAEKVTQGLIEVSAHFQMSQENLRS